MEKTHCNTTAKSGSTPAVDRSTVKIAVSQLYLVEQAVLGVDALAVIAAQLSKCKEVVSIGYSPEKKSVLIVEGSIPRAALQDIVEEIAAFEGIPMSLCSFLDEEDGLSAEGCAPRPEEAACGRAARREKRCGTRGEAHMLGCCLDRDEYC